MSFNNPMTCLLVVLVTGGWAIYARAIVVTQPRICTQHSTIFAPLSVLKCILVFSILAIGSVKYPSLAIGSIGMLACAVWVSTFKIQVDDQGILVRDFRGEFHSSWKWIQRIEIEMIDGDVDNEDCRTFLVSSNGTRRATSSFDLYQLIPFSERIAVCFSDEGGLKAYRNCRGRVDVDTNVTADDVLKVYRKCRHGHCRHYIWGDLVLLLLATLAVTGVIPVH